MTIENAVCSRQLTTPTLTGIRPKGKSTRGRAVGCAVGLNRPPLGYECEFRAFPSTGTAPERVGTQEGMLARISWESENRTNIDGCHPNGADTRHRCRRPPQPASLAHALSDRAFLSASSGRARQRLHRETLGAPTRQAALERANLRDAPSQQGERHPGAGRFVGSRTEENDFDVARNLQVALLQILGGYPEGTGNRIGVGALFQGGTQIHDHRLLPGVDPSLKLYGTDAGDAELSQEAAGPRGLDHKVRNQNGDQKGKGALAKP